MNEMSNDQTRHPSVSALQASVLRRAVAKILTVPRRFNMGMWVIAPDGDTSIAQTAVTVIRHREECRTTFCLAGWIVATTPEEVVKGLMVNEYLYDIADQARMIAKLNDKQATALFHSGAWPPDFQGAYIKAKAAGDYEGMAKALEARIGHYIQTGE